MTDTATGRNESLRELDTSHHFHPFTDHKVLQSEGGPRVIASGDGCWVTDTDGRRLLDGMAGLWCVNVGYGRDELADVARAQMVQLPYYNTFFKTAPAPAIELAVATVLFATSVLASVISAVRIARSPYPMGGPPTLASPLS